MERRECRGPWAFSRYAGGHQILCRISGLLERPVRVLEPQLHRESIYHEHDSANDGDRTGRLVDRLAGHRLTQYDASGADQAIAPGAGVRAAAVDADVIQTSQDAPQESESPANPLEELAWMVGDWVDQDEDATIESSVNWTKNRKFLTRSFRVTLKNAEPHSGMQLIGWDPAENTIRSWTYDAEGGFGEERGVAPATAGPSARSTRCPMASEAPRRT